MLLKNQYIKSFILSLYVPGTNDHSAYVGVLLNSAGRAIGWWYCLYCTRALYMVAAKQSTIHVISTVLVKANAQYYGGHFCRGYCRQCLFKRCKCIRTQQNCNCVNMCNWGRLGFSWKTYLILPQKEHRKIVIMSILKVDMYLVVNPKMILTPRRKGWYWLSAVT